MTAGVYKKLMAQRADVIGYAMVGAAPFTQKCLGAFSPGEADLTQISIGDADLYTETTGQGEDLLLVAGLGGSGTFWRQQLAVLSASYRVTLFDHRGVGRSSPAPLISSVEQLGDDLVRLMDALGIERAHLVGHSTGGAIGQYVALQHPQRLRSLVLSASWAGPTPLFIEMFRLRRDVLINSGIKQYLLLGALLATPAWHLHQRFTTAEDYLVDRTRSAPALEVELGRLNAVMTHDLRHQLHAIKVPTAVLCARDDQITPQPMSAELASLIPGALMRTLPEGGHFCPLTATESYNEALLALLEQLRRPDTSQVDVGAAR
jgi:aminoacrylate hydrolase